MGLFSRGDGTGRVEGLPNYSGPYNLKKEAKDGEVTVYRQGRDPGSTSGVSKGDVTYDVTGKPIRANVEDVPDD
jgi:hypothetical protein